MMAVDVRVDPASRVSTQPQEDIMTKTALARARESDAPARSSTLSPFARMRSLSDEMEHLFADVGTRWPFTVFARDRDGLWSPAIEVEERDGVLCVRADLPGLTKDDIKVDVTDDAVTVEGERKRHEEEKKKGYYRSERSYGFFSRSVALPEGAKADTAKATFKDGVLEVTIEVAASPRPAARRVEIEASSRAPAAL
jgi:HSP20 family protein